MGASSPPGLYGSVDQGWGDCSRGGRFKEFCRDDDEPSGSACIRFTCLSKAAQRGPVQTCSPDRRHSFRAEEEVLTQKDIVDPEEHGVLGLRIQEKGIIDVEDFVIGQLNADGRLSGPWLQSDHTLKSVGEPWGRRGLTLEPGLVRSLAKMTTQQAAVESQAVQEHSPRLGSQEKKCRSAAGEPAGRGSGAPRVLLRHALAHDVVQEAVDTTKRTRTEHSGETMSRFASPDTLMECKLIKDSSDQAAVATCRNSNGQSLPNPERPAGFRITDPLLVGYTVYEGIYPGLQQLIRKPQSSTTISPVPRRASLGFSKVLSRRGHNKVISRLRLDPSIHHGRLDVVTLSSRNVSTRHKNLRERGLAEDPSLLASLIESCREDREDREYTAAARERKGTGTHSRHPRPTIYSITTQDRFEQHLITGE
ncbi:hypothetical protein MAPG_10610 [Magnaporthiopsis poae ATCC 64411]|uniref:Uncharacterized protein n=1 Tax=Magnaporthiopsis poae (strain ATCC 64411 / 73-15) TaxID=644358 RepID=A0A0C4ED18_MAGP6|nr:hypothetical protein MAPG_10610 [Magnaporthiopsis poae ATCC 64411]